MMKIVKLKSAKAYFNKIETIGRGKLRDENIKNV